MMNTTSHLFAATALFALTLVIHILIRNDTNTRPLDTARYYTMVREKGDTSLARSYLDSENTWLSQTCRAAVNSTDKTAACVVERRNLRDSILNAMKCTTYNSQVCAFLRNITSGLIQNRTYGATSYAVGRSLSTTVPGQGSLTYRQLLLNSLDNAPLLFHNSFRAAQADDYYVLRTTLYNFIIFTIIANLLVHYFDQQPMGWTRRLIMRILVFFLFTLVSNFFFLINNWGSALTLLGGIWGPCLVVLFYFEAFLDDSITRPWIHPFTFGIIYSTLSVLSLTENDVLNGNTVGLYLAQSHAITLLYMQIVWYWVGKNEKETHKHAEYHESTHVAAIYTTKEMQYALFLALVLVGLLPLLQANAPLDYNSTDLGTRLAPVVFLILSVYGTLYLQDLKLDDHYGLDAIKPVDKDGAALQGKSLLVWQATRITGGKLAVSLLLLAFGTLYEFNLVGEYFRGLRAYADKLPERAWQYDLQSKYTIGTGFPAISAVYL